MRILLVNVAHPAIGSRLAGEHLPPLGLLAIGGPAADALQLPRAADSLRFIEFAAMRDEQEDVSAPYARAAGP